MDARTRTASPVTTTPITTPEFPAKQEQEQSPPTPDKISAYYSLVFPHFTFYIQTLSITIGRRTIPNPNTATSSTAEPVQVDVDLGALKSVSRLHAKIEYDQDEDRFVLAVIGRNGAWVDGVWSGSGTRAPLGERSQVQIASRTFNFVLPPPPPPEDTPSPSSQSSANRQRSPSLDITSISPPSSPASNFPPPPEELKPVILPPEPQVKLLSQPSAPLQPQLPNSNAIGKANKVNSKKRKKSDVNAPPPPPRPKPEDMPSKPPFTYAQLIYRAIKSIGGKATLQEICNWIMTTHEYYRYADGAWMSSVRHNLSSGRAFKKMERCGGDRGKGFFWSLDEKYQHTFEEQEAKSQQAAANAVAGGSGAGGKDGSGKGGRKKDKGASLLEPPLRRSIKGDTKGGPLPPPLTSTPLVLKTLTTIVTPRARAGISTNAPLATTTSASTPATTGVFAYPTHPHHSHMMPMQQSSGGTSGYSSAPMSAPNPYAALAQSHWVLHPGGSTNSLATTTTPNVSIHSTTNTTPLPIATPVQTPTQTLITPVQPQPNQTPVPDVVIPIILGPIPSTHTDYSPLHPNNSVKEGYMVLHERTLILDPDVFSGLTKEMLTELEKMGARAALVVLTGHMVRALKERRARGRVKRGRGGARGGTGRRGGGPASTPFTNTPLEARKMAGIPSTSVRPSVPLSVPIPAPVPAPIQMDVAGDIGSPIVIVDDSDDEGPITKKRRVDDDVVRGASVTT